MLWWCWWLPPCTKPTRFAGQCILLAPKTTVHGWTCSSNRSNADFEPINLQLLLHAAYLADKQQRCLIGLVYFIVFNATFKNISVISWRSILLVEETGVSEKTTDLQQATSKLYRIMLYSSPWAGIEPTTSVVIDTDRIDSCISNYNTITARTASKNLLQFEWLIVVLRIVINFLPISRTSYISMRWWWSPRCINPTLVVRMYSTSSRNYSAWSDIWLQSVILC